MNKIIIHFADQAAIFGANSFQNTFLMIGFTLSLIYKIKYAYSYSGKYNKLQYSFDELI